MRRKLLRTGLSAAAGGLLLVAGAQLGLSIWLYRALPGPLHPPLEPVRPLSSLSAAGCAGCHRTIFTEWSGSAHAQAQRDPLYQVDLHHQGDFYLCSYCHTPLREQRPRTVRGIVWLWPRLVVWQADNPRYDAALAAEGVTCTACHQRGGALVGPHALTTPLHQTRADPHFADSGLCQPCHSLDLPMGADLKRPIQDTFAEWQGYRAAGGEQHCAGCHMPGVGARPLVEGGAPRQSRSHALRGPSDVEFLRSGLVLREVRIDPAGAAEVTLWNGSGHRLPTAEPRRRVRVSLEALDEGGAVLRGETRLVARLIDPERLTERPGDDTTLLPRETRTLALRLAPPPAAGDEGAAGGGALRAVGPGGPGGP